MNPQEKPPGEAALFAEVDRLIAAIARDGLSAEETVRLEHLLSTNSQARRRYVRSMMLSASLEWAGQGERLADGTLHADWFLKPNSSGAAFPGNELANGDSKVPAENLTFGGLDAVAPMPPQFPSTELPPPIDPTSQSGTHCSGQPEPSGSDLRDPESRHRALILGDLIDGLNQGLAFAFGHPFLVLAGVVGIVSVALLSQVRSTSDPGGAVVGRGTSKQSITLAVDSPAAPKIVAKLTGAWDATWVDRAVAPKDGAALSVGQKLELVGGLVEITFDCGAVAIVQAPASIVLRAANGATLESGRLTVRVSGAEAKFWVQTPSMKVLDLGTEFGISAEPSGASRVHVFEGAVEVEPTASLGDDEPSSGRKLLHAGQEGVIELTRKFSDRPPISPAATSAVAAFVRQMPDNAIADYMRTILASQPWSYWSFNSAINGTLIPDATGNGRFAQLMGGAMVVQGGSVLAVGPAVALNGATDWVSAATGANLSTNGSFSFEAIFRTTSDGAIVSKIAGDNALLPGSKVLRIRSSTLVFEAAKVGCVISSPLVDDGQWHQVIVTNDAAAAGRFDRTILYIDGVERGRSERLQFSSQDDTDLPLKVGGGELSSPDKSSFSGEIDEVAIYDRCLAREEVESHYAAYLRSGMANRKNTAKRGGP